ncbi:hypothetical protein V8C86DRAFT_2468058 [Haematococcus lacustris]
MMLPNESGTISSARETHKRPPTGPRLANNSFQRIVGPQLLFSCMVPYFVATGLQLHHMRLGLIISTGWAGGHLLVGAAWVFLEGRKIYPYILECCMMVLYPVLLGVSYGVSGGEEVVQRNYIFIVHATLAGVLLASLVTAHPGCIQSVQELVPRVFHGHENVIMAGHVVTGVMVLSFTLTCLLYLIPVTQAVEQDPKDGLNLTFRIILPMLLTAAALMFARFWPPTVLRHLTAQQLYELDAGKVLVLVPGGRRVGPSILDPSLVAQPAKASSPWTIIYPPSLQRPPSPPAAPGLQPLQQPAQQVRMLGQGQPLLQPTSPLKPVQLYHPTGPAMSQLLGGGSRVAPLPSPQPESWAGPPTPSLFLAPPKQTVFSGPDIAAMGGGMGATEWAERAPDSGRWPPAAPGLRQGMLQHPGMLHQAMQQHGVQLPMQHDQLPNVQHPVAHQAVPQPMPYQKPAQQYGLEHETAQQYGLEHETAQQYGLEHETAQLSGNPGPGSVQLDPSPHLNTTALRLPVTAQPMQSAMQPMQSVMQPMQSAMQPMQSAMQPMQSAMQPMQYVMQPMHNVMQPMQSAMQPARSAMQPLQSAMQAPGLQQQTPYPSSSSAQTLQQGMPVQRSPTLGRHFRSDA